MDTPPVRDTPDNAGRTPPLLEVGLEEGLRYAVVYLVPSQPAPAVESGKKPPIEIMQEDQEFVPHVVAVRAGQSIAVGNDDAANHNVHAVARNPENEFNVMTPFGEKYEHTMMREPKGRPVKLVCDIHAWMSAWVFVFDHDWFAVTDAAGKFNILDVPAGQYTLTVQQPDGGLMATQDVLVTDNRNVCAEIVFTSGNLNRKNSGNVTLRSDQRR